AAADLFDLGDVDVLGRVVVLVELDRAARVVGGLDGLADGGQEPGAILHLAVDGPGGVGDPAAGAVHDGVEVGGRSLEPGLGQLHEGLVGVVGQRGRPDHGADDSD